MNPKAVKIINMGAVFIFIFLFSFIFGFITNEDINRDTRTNHTEAIIDDGFIAPTLMPFEVVGEAQDGYIEGEDEFIESQRRIQLPTTEPEVQSVQTGMFECYVGNGEYMTLNEVECADRTLEVRKRGDSYLAEANGYLRSIEDDGKQARINACMTRVQSENKNKPYDLRNKLLMDECKDVN
jgi:hypothetical protein